MLSPERFWVLSLLLLVIALGLVQFVIGLCRLAWRAALHAIRGAEGLRRGCGATGRVSFDTSPPQGAV